MKKAQGYFCHISLIQLSTEIFYYVSRKQSIKRIVQNQTIIMFRPDKSGHFVDKPSDTVFGKDFMCQLHKGQDFAELNNLFHNCIGKIHRNSGIGGSH